MPCFEIAREIAESFDLRSVAVGGNMTCDASTRRAGNCLPAGAVSLKRLHSGMSTAATYQA